MKQKAAKTRNESLVVADGSFIFCDSRMVADKFEVQHAKVIRTIELVISKFDEFKSDLKSHLNDEFDAKFINYDDEYRGKKFTAYRMNKTAFSMIAMRFETKAAFKWQAIFAKAFVKMEKALAHIENQKANAEWLERRASGKLTRHEETDTVKIFVDYAKNQGSTKAETYYMNISKMQNKALFLIDQKFHNIRDLLDLHQLSTIEAADRIVVKALQDGMKRGLHYKEIYQIAKNNVETFAMLHGKSSVPVNRIAHSGQKQLSIAQTR